jgi:hypothetical protein
MTKNTLYLAVLPLVRMGREFGLTEQALTLFPDRNLATEFFEDEVDSYIKTFEWRANQYLIGGHVKSYEFRKEVISNKRVIVKVFQNVE